MRRTLVVVLLLLGLPAGADPTPPQPAAAPKPPQPPKSPGTPSPPAAPAATAPAVTAPATPAPAATAGAPAAPAASTAAAPAPPPPPRPVAAPAPPPSKYPRVPYPYPSAAPPGSPAPLDPYAPYAPPGARTPPYGPYAPVPPAAPRPPAAPGPVRPPAVIPGAPPSGAGPDATPRPQRRLTVTTSDAGARTAALACADAIDHDHLDAARTRCAAAVAHDDKLAVAHLWLSQAEGQGDRAASELDRAVRLAPSASRGEWLLIEAWRAVRDGREGDARAAYDELCALLPDEPRAFVARGQLRQHAGDLEGAVADFEHAVKLDARCGVAHNLLGFALVEEGKVDAAQAAFKRYVEAAPSEPNAHDSLAQLALRVGDAAQAVTEARRAVALDDGFLAAHLTLGDALCAQGKTAVARAQYERLMKSTDPAVRHRGSLRAARTLLLEEKWADGERALIGEADLSRKANRELDAAEALVEAALSQVERGALTDAGRGIQEADRSLRAERRSRAPGPPPAAWPRRDELLIEAEVLTARIEALSLLRERTLAEDLCGRLERLLQMAGQHDAVERARALRAFAAVKSGDAGAALPLLEKAAEPTLRLAYAQSVARGADKARARPILEELAHRPTNDIESALVRPRAAAALRALGSEK